MTDFTRFNPSDSTSQRTAMHSRTALVTGLTGQDGSYLAELLLSEGYRVCGLVRPGRTDDVPRTSMEGVERIPADLLDQAALVEILRRVQPDEVYNLAGMTFVP